MQIKLKQVSILSIWFDIRWRYKAISLILTKMSGYIKIFKSGLGLKTYKILN